MNEHDEHEIAMRSPERLILEIPTGHPGHRPFAAIREALRGFKEAEARFVPDLDRVLAGEALAADDVARILQELDQLTAASHHCLQCLAPVTGALADVMLP